MTDPNDYQAYLIRLERSSDATKWLPFLQNVHTGVTYRFKDEHQLLAFLREQLVLPVQANVVDGIPPRAYE